MRMIETLEHRPVPISVDPGVVIFGPQAVEMLGLEIGQNISFIQTRDGRIYLGKTEGYGYEVTPRDLSLGLLHVRHGNMELVNALPVGGYFVFEDGRMEEPWFRILPDHLN